MKRRRPGAAVARVPCEDAAAPIRKQLRIVQNITGCPTNWLNLVLKRLQPFLKGCEHVVNLRMHRVRARQETPVKRTIHGCVGCHEHVFAPKCSDTRCPKCDHPRYCAAGKPNEVFLFACIFLTCVCLHFFFYLFAVLLACVCLHLFLTCVCLHALFSYMCLLAFVSYMCVH